MADFSPALQQALSRVPYAGQYQGQYAGQPGPVNYGIPPQQQIIPQQQFAPHKEKSGISLGGFLAGAALVVGAVATHKTASLSKIVKNANILEKGEKFATSKVFMQNLNPMNWFKNSEAAKKLTQEGYGAVKNGGDKIFQKNGDTVILNGNKPLTTKFEAATIAKVADDIQEPVVTGTIINPTVKPVALLPENTLSGLKEAKIASRDKILELQKIENPTPEQKEELNTLINALKKINPSKTTPRTLIVKGEVKTPYTGNIENTFVLWDADRLADKSILELKNEKTLKLLEQVGDASSSKNTERAYNLAIRRAEQAEIKQAKELATVSPFQPIEIDSPVTSYKPFDLDERFNTNLPPGYSLNDEAQMLYGSNPDWVSDFWHHDF